MVLIIFICTPSLSSDCADILGPRIGSNVLKLLEVMVGQQNDAWQINSSCGYEEL